MSVFFSGSSQKVLFYDGLKTNEVEIMLSLCLDSSSSKYAWSGIKIPSLQRMSVLLSGSHFAIYFWVNFVDSSQKTGLKYYVFAPFSGLF